jgi:hypothetical protein
MKNENRLTDFMKRHALRTSAVRPPQKIRLLIAVAGLLGIQGTVLAQAVPPAGKIADLTGYWVSVVTTLDWRLRMVIPPRGDYFGLRLTPEARKISDAWNQDKDEAAGNQCAYYGGASIMRIPGRLHFTQPDAKTLRLDFDAGTQTRVAHLGDAKPGTGAATWQGESVAEWDASGTGGVKITTTHLKGGYLRMNGVPYSENAIVTEYYDVVHEGTGDLRMVVTGTVTDPKYLQQPFSYSVQFKKQANAAGWDPTPCSARW